VNPLLENSEDHVNTLLSNGFKGLKAENQSEMARSLLGRGSKALTLLKVITLITWVSL